MPSARELSGPHQSPSPGGFAPNDGLLSRRVALADRKGQHRRTEGTGINAFAAAPADPFRGTSSDERVVLLDPAGDRPIPERHLVSTHWQD